MPTATINDVDYTQLKITGFVCPSYFNKKLTVGRQYEIISDKNELPITSRCTQDCPITLKSVEYLNR